MLLSELISSSGLSAAKDYIFSGGGTWSCTSGETDYDVAWTANITIQDPTSGNTITVTDGELAAVPTGNILYVTPSTFPDSSEVLTLAHASVMPIGSIPVGFVLAGNIYVRPMWAEPSGDGGGGDATAFSVLHTTSSAAAGGTTQGSFSVGVFTRATFEALTVTANSASTRAQIEFFADSARTERVYFARNKDCYTAAFEDWTPGALYRHGKLLTSGTVYYTITNLSTTTATTYTITIEGLGR